MVRRRILIFLFLFVPLKPVLAEPYEPTALPPEYVSPPDGARYVHPEASLIIRPARLLDSSGEVNNALFTLTGSLSGMHAGHAVRSDLNDAVVFKPDTPFTPGETVTFRLEPGLRMVGGLEVSPFAETFAVSSPAPELAPNEIDGPSIEKAEPGPSLFPVPTFTTIVSKTTAPGRLFLSDLNFFYPNYDSHLLILDNQGTPYFQRQLDNWGLDFDVQINGMATYFDRAHRAYYAMDTTYTVVDSFRVGNGYTTDLHELRVLPNGHAFLMAVDPQIVDMGQIVEGGGHAVTVLGLIIQELDANKNVVFQWRSWDHFKITDATDWGPPPVIDYVHGNAIDVDTDGNLLLSSRHMDEITKIDRRTGRIIWRLGGKNNQFQFVNDPIGFSHQHDIRRLPNGNITLFDNGNGHVPRFSRAVEYRLDERRKTAELVWEYRHAPEVYSGAMGSVQRLPNGNTLIGWGYAYPEITEVTPAGEVVYEGAFAVSPSGLALDSYRAFRYEWPPRERSADHEAVVTFDPRILNPIRPAGWITARIAPVDFESGEIDPSSLRLGGSIPADPKFAVVSDADLDGRPEYLARFSRGQAARILAPGLSRVEVTGRLTSGETFAGSGQIRVLAAHAGPSAVSVSPNPLNPAGVISFATSRRGRVSVRLFDLSGRLVRTLMDKRGVPPGRHQVRIDLAGDRGDRLLASGVYFYRIRSPGGHAEGRIAVLK